MMCVGLMVMYFHKYGPDRLLMCVVLVVIDNGDVFSLMWARQTLVMCVTCILDVACTQGLMFM